MGTTQDFDLLQIYQVLVKRRALAEINAIEVYTNTRVKTDVTGVCTNTTDINLGAKIRALGNRDVGNVLGQVPQFHNAGLVDRVRTEH